MKFEKVKQIVEELARTNVRLYPRDYPKSNEAKTAANLLVLARNYWDNRTQGEVKRDAEAGVTLEDYGQFCRNAFADVRANG